MIRSKLLLASALVAPLAFTTGAYAADLPAPVYEPVAPVAEAAPVFTPVADVFTWSGPYVGVTAGFGFVHDDDDDGDEGSNHFADGDDDDDETNLVGGALVGYNAQFGSIVVGAEADWMGTDIRTDQRTAVFENERFDEDLQRNVVDAAQFDGHAHMWWLATARLRAGVAFDRFLVYGTGGLAFAHIDLDGRFQQDFNVQQDGERFERGVRGDDDVETGWTLGAGVEAAFTDNLTARLEYLYADFDVDGEDDFSDAFGDDVDDGFEFDTHIIRAGVTFKFGDDLF